MTPPESAKRVSFEEYKLYYESTEKVTDRRLAASNWNYTVCAATLVAIAALSNWALGRVAFLAVALAAIGTLCAVAILFCSLWIGQIRDFKALNNAKFKVLNDMASAVCFSENANDARASFEPFSVEWVELQREQAVTAVRRSTIVALRSSNIEFLIPRVFRLLFGATLVATIVVAVKNWGALMNTSQMAIQSDSTARPTVPDSLRVRRK